MSEENNLIAERKKKLASWEEKGFGYAVSFDRNTTTAQAGEICAKGGLREAGKIMNGGANNMAAMAGRIMNFRDMGKLAFLKIRDGSGDFQVCLADKVLGEDFKWAVKNLDLGDFCGFEGEFFLTKHGEPTLMASSVHPLSKALRPLPEKFHGVKDIETCYRERNLDLATNPETFDRFKKRSQVIRMIRDFFHNHNFDEVETPMLQPQAGGAMARTFMAHHNALDHDFHLRIALELPLKMVCSGGFERVFEIGKNFRNEGADPSHLQEFTMIEWYGAYDTLELHEGWIEDIIRSIGTDVFGKTKFMILDKEEQEVEVDFSQSFAKVSFADLLKQYADIDLFTASMDELKEKAKEVGVEEIENRGRGNLLDDIYKKTARPHLVQPTFVQDWPSDLKPLAKPKGDGTSHVSQLVIAGWEVTNGYGELIDPQVQRQLLEEQQQAKNDGDDEAMEVDESFLKAMEHGFPPMAGNAIGIDRLCALLSGQPNLRDVVLFPTMKPESKPLSSKEAEERYKSRKIVVIADQNHPAGLGAVANAIGQLGISIGMFCEEDLADSKTLHDQDHQTHYVDALYPMANLSGTQAQMAEFAQKCYQAGIQLFDFSEIMRKAHTDKQMAEGYKSFKTQDVPYMAVGAVIPPDFEKEFLSTLDLFGA